MPWKRAPNCATGPLCAVDFILTQRVRRTRPRCGNKVDMPSTPENLIGLFLIASFSFAADADLILRNGKIVTVDGTFSIQQAVAVKGGRIAAVGNNAAILRSEQGPHTRVIDLKGRTVLPGL